MISRDINTPYNNLTQRVAFAHLRSMAEPGPGEAQQALHGFFTALYEAIYDCPELFGFPEAADFYVNYDGEDGSRDKSVVSAKFKPVRVALERGLDLLKALALNGRLEGQSLVVDTGWLEGLLKKTRGVRKFLAGMETAGLLVEARGGETVLRNGRFPAVMPALQGLAQACAKVEDPRLAAFLFARCDFRAAEPGYQPEPLDLYRVFNPDDYQKLAGLHAFLMAKGFKTEVGIGDPIHWEIKYFGNRKIKSTAMYQVGYSIRDKHPMLVQIKCASTNRIADLIPQQSPELQEDFRHKRINVCRASECDWCKDKPNLGPSVVVIQGEQIAACWYTNPDIRSLTDGMVAVVKEYVEMHDKLLSAA